MTNQLLRGDMDEQVLSGPCKLQIVDIYGRDIDYKRYEIDFFCIDEESNSFCVKVDGFEPYFYLAVPKGVSFDDFSNWIGSLNVDTYGNGRNIAKMAKFEKFDKFLFRGYQKDKTTFAKLSFRSYTDYKKVKWFLKNNRYVGITGRGRGRVKLCEADIDPVIKYCHEKNIKPAGWIKVSDYSQVTDFKFSSCQNEIVADADDVEHCETAEIGKFLIASFDIETTTKDLSRHPMWQCKTDTIIQIATTVERFGDPDWSYKFIAVLGPCGDIPGATVLRCETEKDLITGWCKFIRRLDPDILTGYNTTGFDYEYIMERAYMLDLSQEVSLLSRIEQPLKTKDMSAFNQKYAYKTVSDMFKKENERKASRVKAIMKKIYIQQESSSKAFGDNKLKYINAVGRVNLDLLKYCRENGDKLANYKLDTVSKHYGISNGKNDMPYKRMYQIYLNGSVEEKQEVAEYCIQDCRLCNQLITKMNVIPNIVGMANTCSVPLQYLMTRGQTIKIYSLLLKECDRLGYIIPARPKVQDIGSYKGAIVLKADAGAKFFPVSVLDFASLYPSCMISHNLCTSTKLDEKEALKMKHDEYRKISWVDELEPSIITKTLLRDRLTAAAIFNRYRDLKEICISYDHVEAKKHLTSLQKKVRAYVMDRFRKGDTGFFRDFGIDIKNLSEKAVGTTQILYITRTHYYYQKTKGVFPFVLQKLLDARNRTKKLKKKFAKTNPFLSDVYDGLQLSYKITANSVYGQLGAAFSSFGNPDIAATVTAVGRKLLIIANDIIAKNFDQADTVYGDTDSVFMRFLLKDHVEQCRYHESKMDQRLKMFHNIKDSRVKDMIKNNTPFEHSHEYTCMKDVAFSFNGPCNCKPLSNQMSKEALSKSIVLAKYAGEIVTSLLPDRKRVTAEGKKVGVQELEYEKTYHPFLLFCKKRYVGKLYTNGGDEKGKTDYKGIILKRRDTCGVTKKIYAACLESVLNGSIEGGLQCLRKELDKLLDNGFPMEDFVITKLLKAYSSYKVCKKTGRINQAHVAVAQRVEARDRGSAFQVNSRVPYCFIETGSPYTLQIDRVETPEFITANKIPLDYAHYITNQLQKPIVQIFATAGSTKAYPIFKQYLAKYKAKVSKTSLISSFFCHKPSKPKPVVSVQENGDDTFFSNISADDGADVFADITVDEDIWNDIDIALLESKSKPVQKSTAQTSLYKFFTPQQQCTMPKQTINQIVKRKKRKESKKTETVPKKKVVRQMRGFRVIPRGQTTLKMGKSKMTIEQKNDRTRRRMAKLAKMTPEQKAALKLEKANTRAKRERKKLRKEKRKREIEEKKRACANISDADREKVRKQLQQNAPLNTNPWVLINKIDKKKE